MSWISVAERLPEPDVRVLVWLSSHLPNVRIASRSWPDERDRWCWWGAAVPSRNGNVTHWMPLPDPPARGEE